MVAQQTLLKLNILKQKTFIISYSLWKSGMGEWLSWVPLAKDLSWEGQSRNKPGMHHLKTSWRTHFQLLICLWAGCFSAFPQGSSHMAAVSPTPSQQGIGKGERQRDWEQKMHFAIYIFWWHRTTPCTMGLVMRSYKKGLESMLSLRYMRTQWENGHLQAWERAFTRSHRTEIDTLILEFLVFRTVRNKYPLFKPHSLWYFYGSPR